MSNFKREGLDLIKQDHDREWAGKIEAGAISADKEAGFIANTDSLSPFRKFHTVILTINM